MTPNAVEPEEASSSKVTSWSTSSRFAGNCALMRKQSAPGSETTSAAITVGRPDGASRESTL